MSMGLLKRMNCLPERGPLSMTNQASFERFSKRPMKMPTKMPTDKMPRQRHNRADSCADAAAFEDLNPIAIDQAVNHANGKTENSGNWSEKHVVRNKRNAMMVRISFIIKRLEGRPHQHGPDAGGERVIKN